MICRKVSPSPVALGRHLLALILDCFDWIPREEEVESRGDGGGDEDERAFDSAPNLLRDRMKFARGIVPGDWATLQQRWFSTYCTTHRDS